MDPVDYIHNTVVRDAITCDVLRPDSGQTYGNDPTQVDTVAVAIFAGTPSSFVETEGTGQDVSFTGLLNPQYDTNDDLIEVVKVGDILSPVDSPKQYDVRTKFGDPTPHDPETWVVGLDVANST